MHPVEFHAPIHAADLSITRVVSGRFRQNGYIVKSEGSSQCLMIDPGNGAPEVLTYLQDRDLRPQKIILTHGHFDHIGAVKPLSDYYDIPCLVHAADVKLVKQALLYSIRFSKEPIQTPDNIDSLRADSALVWEGKAIEIYETPGHTPGSVCFRVASFLFTGDLLFHEAVGPTLAPLGNLEILQQSVARILNQTDDTDIIFPGHGKHWSVGEAKRWWSDHKDHPPCIDIFS